MLGCVWRRVMRVRRSMRSSGDGVRIYSARHHCQPRHQQVTHDFFHSATLPVLFVNTHSPENERVLRMLGMLDLAHRLAHHRPAAHKRQNRHTAGHQQIWPGASRTQHRQRGQHDGDVANRVVA